MYFNNPTNPDYIIDRIQEGRSIADPTTGQERLAALERHLDDTLGEPTEANSEENSAKPEATLGAAAVQLTESPYRDETA